MSKKFRDWLFILFIALFVIITFFVSLYAVGYSIDRRWPPRFNQFFQKTGMLILDSEPTEASIFLNGTKQRRSLFLDLGRNDITTPVKIKNLIPGEYTLRLEKEGYWPLEKKLQIYSGQTSFAEDLILFKRSLPMNLTLCAPQELFLSPDKKNLFLAGEGSIINLKTENVSPIKTSTTTSMQWSKDSSQILLNGSLIDLEGKASGYDLSAIGQEAQDFYWDEADKKIYYRSGGNISCILTKQNTVSTILSGSDYSAYTVKNNLIYTVERQNGQYYLRVYNASSAIRQSSQPLPAGDYVFYHDDYHLSLYDRKQESLYLLSEYTDQVIIKQIRPASAWQWLDKNRLIWHNEFEIYSLDINNNQQNLLIRVSEPITGFAWHRTKNYLLYASDTEIKIINLNLDKREPISLLQANNIVDLALDEKNQLLYFYAQIGQQGGIYKLQLQ
jgi:hypothetical protein